MLVEMPNSEHEQNPFPVYLRLPAYVGHRTRALAKLPLSDEASPWNTNAPAVSPSGAVEAALTAAGAGGASVAGGASAAAAATASAAKSLFASGSEEEGAAAAEEEPEATEEPPPPPLPPRLAAEGAAGTSLDLAVQPERSRSKDSVASAPELGDGGSTLGDLKGAQTGKRSKSAGNVSRQATSSPASVTSNKSKASAKAVSRRSTEEKPTVKRPTPRAAGNRGASVDRPPPSGGAGV